MRIAALIALAGTLLATYLSKAQAPTAGASRVDALAYDSDGAAQTAWRPMAGSAPVSMTRIDGRPALKMPCNFAGTKIERASWDRAVQLDMSSCRALRFRMFCRNSEPISNFMIYLQSGNGWYTASFAPSRADGWNTITINRDDTRTEGAPAGWSSIRTIRISAWRGNDQDTEFAIADLALVGDRADVCILRNEAAARTSPGEVDSVNQFCKGMGATLRDLGLDYSILSDVDLTSERLKDTKLLILPHNPAMTPAAIQVIRSYLEHNGRLLAFYTMPAELRDATGIELGRHIPAKIPGQFSSIRFADNALPGAPPIVQQKSWNIHAAQPLPGRGRILANWFDADGKPTGLPALVASDNCIFMTHVLLGDDPANKSRMLLAMAGQLVPDLWAKCARGILQQAGQFGPYTDWTQAAKAIAAQGQARSAESLATAEKARKQAEDLLSANKFSEAIQSAQLAQHLLLESYCLAQFPQPDEQRGFWCHSAFGPAGMTWDQSIRILADNGFNAIFPNMLWGGVAYYDSSVLPVAPEVKERGDQIAQCVAACRKYGVACHVWKVNWNMGGRAPREFAQRMKREGRTQVKFDGSPNDTWLCPSNPENQKLEIDAMVEVATKYDVDGIHFDYIRYPDANGCFCPGCRERFEKSIGRAVENWPADVRRDPDLSAKWLDFRRDNITRTVAAVAEAVHKSKPKVKISAAVFPNWSVDRDAVGQDWKLWCERGYVDFVCPMDYTPHNVAFENLVRRQLAWAGQTPVYPGIGLSTWGNSSDNLVSLIEKINIARQLGAHGFTIFEYQASGAQDIVPLCGKGITRRQP